VFNARGSEGNEKIVALIAERRALHNEHLPNLRRRWAGQVAQMLIIATVHKVLVHKLENWKQ
jgi:hypothetical protein